MTFQFVGALVEDDIVEVVVVGGFDDDFVTRRCRPVWRPYLMALAGRVEGHLNLQTRSGQSFTRLLLPNKYDMCWSELQVVSVAQNVGNASSTQF